jgi:DNA-binding NtrC family response regulator
MVTILCIDDDLKILQVHKAVLGTRGYTVLTAPDGLSGIAITRSNSIDVVVTDFQMPPGMDGGRVAELLMKEKPTLPVVICSGCLDEIPPWLKYGAHQLLAKGEGPSSLLSLVEKLVAVKATAKKRTAPMKNKAPLYKKACHKMAG